MKHYINTILITFTFLNLLTSCGPKSTINFQPVPLENFPSEEELMPYSSQVVYAKNWSEIIIHANFAKTTITIGAHFSTTRNACGRDAYGAIPLQAWNKLAQSINQAVSTPLGEEYCMPEAQELDSQGYYKKHVDGSVEIKLDDKKTLVLFLVRDGQICTHLKDHALAETLHQGLNNQVAQADREECPNGWGSN
jgi:hypothetical protein